MKIYWSCWSKGEKKSRGFVACDCNVGFPSTLLLFSLALWQVRSYRMTTKKWAFCVRVFFFIYCIFSPWENFADYFWIHACQSWVKISSIFNQKLMFCWKANIHIFITDRKTGYICFKHFIHCAVIWKNIYSTLRIIHEEDSLSPGLSVSFSIPYAFWPAGISSPFVIHTFFSVIWGRVCACSLPHKTREKARLTPSALPNWTALHFVHAIVCGSRQSHQAFCWQTTSRLFVLSAGM